MKLETNEIKHYCAGASLSIMTHMLGGAILQAFMAECGVPEDNIGMFVAIAQIVQLGMIMLLSPLVDKIKRVLAVNALFSLLAIPMIAICIYLCVVRSVRVETAFILILTGGIIWNIAYGIYSVVAYKAPYHIIDMKYYGRLVSQGGAISGILGVIFSAVMTYMQGSMDYFDAMLLFYGVCLVFCMVYVIVSLSYKEIDGKLQNAEKQKSKRINLLKYKPFTVLIIPNILRGFCMGAFGMAVTVGYYFGILDGATASLVVVITSVMNIFSSLIFEKLNITFGTDKIILASSIVLAASLPLMLVGNNAISFLVFLGIAAFTINVVNCSVPVAVVKLIDYGVAGSYNGYRMMLNTCGSALSGFILIGMLERFGGIASLCIAGACQIVSGVVYYIYLKTHK